MVINLRKIALLFLLIIILFFVGCKSQTTVLQEEVETFFAPNKTYDETNTDDINRVVEEADQEDDVTILYGEKYNSAEEVAYYINQYHELPPNYLTKKEANELGWPEDGYLNEVAPGMSIGGDRFGNREGLLPAAKDRVYFECDINYESGKRNAKRLVYSNDGLIFYTEDHYASFEQLY